jgi:hypothetical protein
VAAGAQASNRLVRAVKEMAVVAARQPGRRGGAVGTPVMILPLVDAQLADTEARVIGRWGGSAPG